MKLYKSFLTIVILLHSVLNAQDESWKVYDDSQLAQIKITMDSNDFQYMQTNTESDSLHMCTIYFKNAFIDDTVSQVGIRLRGNTSRDMCKKSYKLNFNKFIDNGEFYSLERMNLNGENNDPTLMRSKLSWDLYQDMDMKTSRAAHIEVYINDEYFGLYTSVEQIDDEFLEKNFNDDNGNLWKCLHPANLLYLGSDPNLYKYTVEGQRSYDLKTNETEDDYTKLAELIDVINNSPDSLFFDSLMGIMNIEDLFKYYSFDILSGSWDNFWYGWNNYYLYYEPSKEIFQVIPYDYDNTFGIDFRDYDDWATRDIYNWGNVDQPNVLNNRILATPQLRNLLTHFLNFYSDEVFQLSNWEERADSIKEFVTNAAERGPDNCYGFSYGFTALDFHQSYDSTGYFYENNLKLRRSIKEFVNARNISIDSQIEFLSAPPSIYKFSVNKNILFDGDSLSIKSSIFSSIGLSKITAEIKDGQTIHEMYELDFDPNLESKDISKRDRWKVKFLPTGNWKSGKLRIIAEDSEGKKSIYPKDGLDIQRVTEKKSDIYINEIMASNSSIISDEFNEFDDWIELYNSSDSSFSISGGYLTDDRDNLVKWKIPDNLSIDANSYKIIWCDDNVSQGSNHANFKLNSNGEFLALVDIDGVTILDSVEYPSLVTDHSYGRNLSIDSSYYYFAIPTPNASNFVQAGEKTSEVLINEIMALNETVLTDENSEFEDWIEIYNIQDTIVNLSGKYLSDNKNYPGKWKFPENTFINPGEFLIVWCDDDSAQTLIHSNFELSSNGEFLSIVEPDGVTIVDSVSFPQLMADESYARNTTNFDIWEVSSTATPGSNNLITDIESVPVQLNNSVSVYPNPFNPTTTIQYELESQMDIELKIFDIIGREVWSSTKEDAIAGKHSLIWNGKNHSGNNLSSGIYFLQINGNDFVDNVKLVLIK